LSFSYSVKNSATPGISKSTGLLYSVHLKQDAQLMLTNPRDAFRGHWRSPYMVWYAGYSFLL